MRIRTLFGTILHSTYAASGGKEPLERYYACMFGSYFDHLDAQPSCSTVQAILRGEHLPPRKLLQFYRDPNCPRCPEKLAHDLSALTECCFVDISHREELEQTLSAFLKNIPEADVKDLLELFSGEDLIHQWTCLTWYALCGDHCG